ncbi:TetR/AcrR family transcriptional regulator [Methylobacterium sp. J-030]|uniref:TetR/AcrR family transcriptional regulator n=1 Tax=Methylobacterium sp. J-030 TaxID=2836627 RepID=UPI001FB919B2|nr:TetR/AcrR family transcriptional regulator [Methylobacterium sp. J-030]MCJ2072111.1 TetR/AcrR family transcriptional regulator [Methylobacterium sp. J-030]
MNTSASAAPYHHGDLRRALLDSATAILTETGRWDFSLREVARRAGVSHAASYRHFTDKEALIAAIAVTGYEALRARMSAAIDGASGAVETLRAIGHAYIGFGVENPALYRLMFGQALPGIEGLPPTVLAVLTEARAVLRGVILDGARTGTFAIDPEDEQAVSVAVVTAWSLVHGFTLLTIDRVVDREVRPRVIEALTARVTERLIIGLLPT